MRTGYDCTAFRLPSFVLGTKLTTQLQVQANKPILSRSSLLILDNSRGHVLNHHRIASNTRQRDHKVAASYGTRFEPGHERTDVGARFQQAFW